MLHIRWHRRVPPSRRRMHRTREDSAESIVHNGSHWLCHRICLCDCNVLRNQGHQRARLDCVSDGFKCPSAQRWLTEYCSVPIYELWRQATNSDAAATVFLVVLLTINLFVVNAVQQTSSHLIWAFGRDNGLVLSKQLAQMHHGLEVPVWSLLANAVVIFICGCIYLASTAAFNALINTTIILQMISFAMPCFLLMCRGRSENFLAKNRWFRLPGWLGWTCNATVVVFAIIEVVFFDLPTSIPTTGSSMSKLLFCSFVCGSDELT